MIVCLIFADALYRDKRRIKLLQLSNKKINLNFELTLKEKVYLCRNFYKYII
jgi:hypothetical protein